MGEQTPTPEPSARPPQAPSWWGEGAAVSSSSEREGSTSSSAETRISDITHQAEEAFTPPAYWVTPDLPSVPAARPASRGSGARKLPGAATRRSNRTRHVLLAANLAVVLVIAVLATLLLSSQQQSKPEAVKPTSPPVSLAKTDHYEDFPSGTRGKTCIDPTKKISGVNDGDYRIVGSGMSCNFVDMIVLQLTEQLQNDPRSSHLTLERVRSLQKEKDYSLACNRVDHLSRCVGKSDGGGLLDIFLTDHVHD